MKNYICELCEKDFCTKGELTKHISRKRKNYQCEVCETFFSSPGGLKQHINKVHTGNFEVINVIFGEKNSDSLQL